MGADFDGWSKVVIVAGGPSLTQQQCDAVSRARMLEKVRTFAVNRAWERIGKADVLYAADREWWETYYPKVVLHRHIVDRMYTANADIARAYGIDKMRAKAHPGINFDVSTGILHGTNSGHQALNLAVHHGAKQIILLGFDFKAQWHRNWHDEYPTVHMNRPHAYGRWITEMNQAANDLKAHCIDVVNCSPDSALECFRMATIDEALAS